MKTAEIITIIILAVAFLGVIVSFIMSEIYIRRMWRDIEDRQRKVRERLNELYREMDKYNNQSE